MSESIKNKAEKQLLYRKQSNNSKGLQSLVRVCEREREMHRIVRKRRLAEIQKLTGSSSRSATIFRISLAAAWVMFPLGPYL